MSDSTTVVTDVLGVRLSSDLWLICAGSVSKVLLSGLTIGSCVDVLALRWLAKSTKMSNCGKPFLVVPLEKRPFFFELLLFLLVEVAARHQNSQQEDCPHTQ